MKVAIETWRRVDGTFGSLNPCFHFDHVQRHVYRVCGDCDRPQATGPAVTPLDGRCVPNVPNGNLNGLRCRCRVGRDPRIWLAYARAG